MVYSPNLDSVNRLTTSAIAVDGVAKSFGSTLALAGVDLELGSRLQREIASPRFRVYLSEDIRGVELCATVKNIIALGAGAPIFVEEDVLHRTKSAMRDKEGRELPDQLKELIEGLNPEDFEGKA